MKTNNNIPSDEQLWNEVLDVLHDNRRELSDEEAKALTAETPTKIRWIPASAITSVAAAILIAVLLWPEGHKESITPSKPRPVIAEVVQPEPKPEPLPEERKEPPHKTQKARKAKEPAALPTQETTAIAEALPATSLLQEETKEQKEELIPADKQALANIYLAEEALQVAYELEAQQEALRAYEASITGKEEPKTIIAF